jgi:hypothetical protein
MDQYYFNNIISYLDIKCNPVIARFNTECDSLDSLKLRKELVEYDEKSIDKYLCIKDRLNQYQQKHGKCFQEVLGSFAAAKHHASSYLKSVSPQLKQIANTKFTDLCNFLDAFYSNASELIAFIDFVNTNFNSLVSGSKRIHDKKILKDISDIDLMYESYLTIDSEKKIYNIDDRIHYRSINIQYRSDQYKIDLNEKFIQEFREEHYDYDLHHKSFLERLKFMDSMIEYFDFRMDKSGSLLKYFDTIYFAVKHAAHIKQQ